jgi:hypothetical protein
MTGAAMTGAAMTGVVDGLARRAGIGPPVDGMTGAATTVGATTAAAATGAVTTDAAMIGAVTTDAAMIGAVTTAVAMIGVVPVGRALSGATAPAVTAKASANGRHATPGRVARVTAVGPGTTIGRRASGAGTRATVPAGTVAAGTVPAGTVPAVAVTLAPAVVSTSAADGGTARKTVRSGGAVKAPAAGLGTNVTSGVSGLRRPAVSVVTLMSGVVLPRTGESGFPARRPTPPNRSTAGLAPGQLSPR